MSPGEIFGLCIALVIFACILPFVFRRKKADMYEDIARGAFPPKRVAFGKRHVRHNPALGAGYVSDNIKYHRRYGPGGNTLTPRVPIMLTPNQVALVNVQRSRRGKPMFNRTGLTNAIAHPWNRADVPQPRTTEDWLSYLIAFEIMNDDHTTVHTGSAGGVMIEPDKPYNGQGGEFAGGGASGDWGNSITRSEGTAIDRGSPIAGAALGVGAGMLDDAGGPARAPSDTSSVVDSSPSYSPSSDSGSSGGSDSGGSSSGSDGGSAGGGDGGGGG